jgi:fumarate hydratase class II
MRWCSGPTHFARCRYRFYKICNDIRLMSYGPRAGFEGLKTGIVYRLKGNAPQSHYDVCPFSMEANQQ